MDVTIYDGAPLAHNLGVFGCPAEFVGHTIAPAAVVYRFKPLDLARYTERKAKTAAERLGVFISRPVRFSSTSGGFSIAIDREERRFVNLWQCNAPLIENAPRVFIPLGIDDEGNARAVALEDCPHLLIAGASGSGKTSYLHAIIGGICCNARAGLMLIDCKRVEFGRWAQTSNLTAPIIIDARKAAGYLRGAVEEMGRRYNKLRAQGLRDNSAGLFPPLVIIIDEFADLILSNREEVEPLIIKISQLGRAAGVHLIIATQRPTVNILSGLILANIPARVCLSVAAVRDSVVMLDHKGGEELRGKGDAIVKLANGDEFHTQAPYLTAEQIEKLTAPLPHHPKFKENGELWDAPPPPPQTSKRGLFQRLRELFRREPLTVGEMLDGDEILD